MGFVLLTMGCGRLSGFDFESAERAVDEELQQVRTGAPDPGKFDTEVGPAYFTRLSGGDSAVLFTTWRGKGRNFHGYLFHTSKSAIATPAQLEITVPDINGLDKRFVELDEQVRPHWYLVHYDLD
ncbi:MAG: hypothetical protein U0795_07105 [Pirellulales bacterium]